MSTYQAIYDATRQSLRCDPQTIIENAAREAFDVSYLKMYAQEHMAIVREELIRPSVLFRPSVQKDGNQWIALYGENLQEGVAGCGDTPALAMEDFDKNWKRP